MRWEMQAESCRSYEGAAALFNLRIIERVEQGVPVSFHTSYFSHLSTFLCPKGILPSLNHALL